MYWEGTTTYQNVTPWGGGSHLVGCMMVNWSFFAVESCFGGLRDSYLHKELMLILDRVFCYRFGSVCCKNSIVSVSVSMSVGPFTMVLALARLGIAAWFVLRPQNAVVWTYTRLQKVRERIKRITLKVSLSHKGKAAALVSCCFWIR